MDREFGKMVFLSEAGCPPLAWRHLFVKKKESIQANAMVIKKVEEKMSEKILPCERCGLKTGCRKDEIANFCDSCNKICPQTVKGERYFGHRESALVLSGALSFGGAQNIGIVGFQVWGIVRV